MGETISMYLVDGTSDGLMKVEVEGWTGIVLVAPRLRYKELQQSEEAKKPGVYILVGTEGEKEKIYIGESDDLWERLDQHTKDEQKEFWQRTIIITSKDENFTKAYVRFLESKLVRIAVERGKSADRTIVANGTIPEPANLPERTIDYLTNKFLPYLEILLPVIGLRFTLPTLKQVESFSQQSTVEGYDVTPVFYLKHKSAEARLRQISSDFFVLKGSTAVKTMTASLSDRLRHYREQLLNQRILVESENPDELVFTDDVSFTSLSAAASFVSGTSVNGTHSWRLENGMRYYEWEASKNS
jgi:hypothetical protein